MCKDYISMEYHLPGAFVCQVVSAGDGTISSVVPQAMDDGQFLGQPFQKGQNFIFIFDAFPLWLTTPPFCILPHAHAT